MSAGHKPMRILGLFILGIVFVLQFVLQSPESFAFDKDLLNRNIVLVRGYDRTKILSVQNGVVLTVDDYNSYVLTNADPFVSALTFTVLHSITGAELIAQRVWADNNLDLALFKVNGLNLPPLVFSATNPREGDAVTLVHKSLQDGARLSFLRGGVRRLYPYAATSQSVRIMVHDAGVDEVKSGVLVANDCGELVGFNLKGNANELVRSITANSLKAVLQRKNVPVSVAPARCLSAIEQARSKAELAMEKARQAQAEVEAAKLRTNELLNQLKSVNTQNLKLEEQTSMARNQADRALRKAEDTEREIAAVRVEAANQTTAIMDRTQHLLAIVEEERKTADRAYRQILADLEQKASRRENSLLILLGLLSLAALVVYVLFRRRRPGQVSQALASEPGNQQPEPGLGQMQDQSPDQNPDQNPNEIEKQKQSHSEYVLEGRDADGIRYLLRISSHQLSKPDGVIIGRNPVGSAYVINHADVSRNHVRVKIMKNRLFIEDLGSTNGTIVNGQAIQKKGHVTIADGDQIIIGSIQMNLRVLKVA